MGKLTVLVCCDCVCVPNSCRLLISTILRCRAQSVACFGLVCSSFVSMSRGSTHRHFFLPMGDLDAPSVQLGNLLAARTVRQCGSVLRHANLGWNVPALRLQLPLIFQDFPGHDPHTKSGRSLGSRATCIIACVSLAEVSTSSEADPSCSIEVGGWGGGDDDIHIYMDIIYICFHFIYTFVIYMYIYICKHIYIYAYMYMEFWQGYLLCGADIYICKYICMYVQQEWGSSLQ